MKSIFFYIFLLSLFFSSCQSSYKIKNSAKNGAHKSRPSGKYKNPTMFSRVNPFQGRAKAKLNKTKRKKSKLFKRKRKQRGTTRKVKKPGKSFGLKRTISRKRLKSSGSRIKSGGGRRKKNKNLFKTKKR